MISPNSVINVIQMSKAPIVIIGHMIIIRISDVDEFMDYMYLSYMPIDMRILNR